MIPYCAVNSDLCQTLRPLVGSEGVPALLLVGNRVSLTTIFAECPEDIGRGDWWCWFRSGSGNRIEIRHDGIRVFAYATRQYVPWEGFHENPMQIALLKHNGREFLLNATPVQG